MNTQHQPLSKLPSEVILIILGMLPQLSDVTSLAATNTKHFRIASRFLYQKDAREESPKALTWAARNGQLNTLRKALDEVDDIDFIDEKGNTALHFATYCFAPIVDAIIESLITANASLDSAYGHPVGTPLELACENQNFRAAILLIRAGAEVPKSLLDTCVLSIKPKSAGGLVPDIHQEEFAFFQQEAISKLIHNNSTSWDLSSEYKYTPLMRAVSNGELSVVQLLLNLGVKVNEKGGNGWTALMRAAHNSNIECVKILTAAGANINILDDDGVSAIYLASYENEFSRNTLDIWDCFLDKGVDIQREFWYPMFGCSLSIFELAVLHALRGRDSPLDLIIKHPESINYSSIQRVLGLLDRARYNESSFLTCIKEDSDNWTEVEEEKSTTESLRSLQSGIVSARGGGLITRS